MQSLDSHRSLKIGTRASPMARAMAEIARKVIAEIAPSIDLSILAFTADGDRINGSLQSYGGKGTFIKDLERRLLSGEVDCAIHSLKDIPGDLPLHDELTLISFMTREDPRDALILRAGVSEDELRNGGIIGTSAPRRNAALKNLYPAAEVKLCRGNVNSRLHKLDLSHYDAIVLSYAGLKRLDLDARANRVYSADEILPAVGQGIVTIQVRKSDVEKCHYLRRISDAKTETAAKVERAMLFKLQGNCHSAIAGHCSFLPDNRVHMRGMVYNSATGEILNAERQSEHSHDIETLGTMVADDLLLAAA